jgi:hypothetical protein
MFTNGETTRPTPQEKKDDLIAGLADVRDRIIREAGAMPPKIRDVVFLGTWSIRDLLAHLAGWDVTNLRATKDILNGKLPRFMAYYDEDWATYNGQLILKYGRKKFARQVALLEKTHRELIEYLKEVPPEEFDKDRDIHFEGYKVTLAWLIKAEFRDEEEHLNQVLEFTSSLSNPR